MSLVKKIVIDIETDAKHLLLHFDQLEPIAAAALDVLGATRAAAFLAELGTLAEAAAKAYEDASRTTITPEHVAALLPSTTPLVPPAAVPAVAATPAPALTATPTAAAAPPPEAQTEPE